MDKIDKESIERLEKFMDSAYLKPKRTLATMLSEIFIEKGWIEENRSAYGVQKKNAFEETFHGVYVARRTSTGKTIREIEYNRLFKTEEKMRKYITYLRGLKI